MKFEARRRPTPPKATAFLHDLHELSMIQKALDIARLLENHVSWDLSLSTALFHHDEAPEEARRVAMALLGLHEQAGDALMRGAKLFAACDDDRAGGLSGPEVLAAAVAIRDNVQANEATWPEGVDPDQLDAATAAALSRFHEECLEHLHEISLLRMLVPPADASWGVRAIAANASLRARGGEEGQRAAAAEAIEDALAAEISRVTWTVGDSNPLSLLPFLKTFGHVVHRLAASRLAVIECSRSARAATANGHGIAIRPPDRCELRRAADEAAAAERRRIEQEAGRSDLERLLDRTAVGGQGGQVGAGAAAAAGGPTAGVPISGGGGGEHAGPRRASKSAAHSAAGAWRQTPLARPTKYDSPWAPMVTFSFFERARDRRRLDVDKFFAAMDPAREHVVISGEDAWLVAEPPAGLVD